MKQFGAGCLVFLGIAIFCSLYAMIMNYLIFIHLDPMKWICVKAQIIRSGPPSIEECIEYSKEKK